MVLVAVKKRREKTMADIILKGGTKLAKQIATLVNTTITFPTLVRKVIESNSCGYSSCTTNWVTVAEIIRSSEHRLITCMRNITTIYRYKPQNPPLLASGVKSRAFFEG